MRKAIRPAFVASLLAVSFAALGLAGCGEAAQPAVVQPTATTPASTSGDANGGLQDARPTVEKDASGAIKVPPSDLPLLPLLEVAEITQVRDELSKSLGKISWIDASQGESQQNQDAQEKALEAIQAEGARLAAVKYVPLALDAYKEVTGKLQLTGDDFQTGDVVLDSIGQIGGTQRYLLYSYKGKDIPQRPDRDQVFRWVQSYALYDNTTRSVIKIVATIHGEVHE